MDSLHRVKAPVYVAPRVGHDPGHKPMGRLQPLFGLQKGGPAHGADDLRYPVNFSGAGFIEALVQQVVAVGIRPL
jgi:hypothetical protein